MTLTIQDLGALGELLGSVAVLATLVYLALQTRQNTMAIGAQLDAAVIGANQNAMLLAATSNELGEALREDIAADITTSQMRLAMYFQSNLATWQWQLHQARRGLLPDFHEAGMAGAVRTFFTAFPSFEGTWERIKPDVRPEFVEWVEEQRSKAAGGASPALHAEASSPRAHQPGSHSRTKLKSKAPEVITARSAWMRSLVATMPASGIKGIPSIRATGSMGEPWDAGAKASPSTANCRNGIDQRTAQ